MASPESGQYVEIPPTASEFRFHVASYFLVHKPPHEIDRILVARELPPGEYIPVMIPNEVKKLLWDEAQADEEGYFTFHPGVIVLGHTAESIRIPLDRDLRMRSHFVLESLDWRLPLTTNLEAPGLHAGSVGPQTYEIVNESRSRLKLRVADLVCIADVLQLTGKTSLLDNKGTFSAQKVGEISPVGASSWEEEAIRRAILARRASES